MRCSDGIVQYTVNQNNDKYLQSISENGALTVCNCCHPVAPPTCKPDQYKCKSGECVLRSRVCDGREDCNRGDDEANCKCFENGVNCTNGERLCASVC